MNAERVALSERVANAPCSWGVLEFDLPGEKLGYAQVLDEIRETGYRGTELGDWGFMPTEPSRLRDELRRRDLQLLGAFVPVDFSNRSAHSDGEQRALKTARLMSEAVGGSPFIVLADENGKSPVRTGRAGRITIEDALSDAQWEDFCRGVNLVAGAVRRETGLRAVFHHHCAGYVETPAEMERLLQGTDADLVGLCFDTGHYLFGGGADAAAAYRQFKDRIWHVHFKDYQPATGRQSREEKWNYFESLKHGVFCELGQGAVDFKRLIRELQDDGYPGWIIVEQDVLPGRGTPKEFARANREFLRGCGL